MSNNGIGAIIIAYREKLRYTQTEFAELINVSQPTLSRWENGVREPRISDLENICKKLGISLNTLFAEDMSQLMRIKKRLFWLRICSCVLLASFLVALYFIVPKYKIVSDPTYSYDDSGCTLTLIVKPLLAFDEKSAILYCESISEKYKENENIDVLRIHVAYSVEDADSLESTLLTITYMVNRSAVE